MVKLRSRLFFSVAVASALFACGGSDDGAAGGDGDSVDLPGYVESAGLPDIRHGTAVYTPPPAVTREKHDRVFVAFLNGGQEVPPVRTPASGAMVLFLNRAGNRADYFLSHNVAGATVAHLHAASAGENGPVAVALPSAAPNTSGQLTLTADQSKALLAGNLYANVHSAANMAGEIRGQVLRPGETLFTTPLTGLEEVPAVKTANSGVASVVLNAARDQIRYRFSAKGIVPSMAHFHRGIAGVNGPVVYPVKVDDTAAVGSAVTQVFEGVQAVTPADVQDLARRQWYVNIHSFSFPLGELRGQLLRPGEELFTAKLSGTQEVPAVATTQTGNAMIVLGMGGAQFLYSITTDAAPTMAHIHKAPGGLNGPVVVPFEPGQQIFGFESLGPERAADARRGLWYVNLHTAERPMGELRGQVIRPGETLYTALLAGTNEVPPVTTMATGGLGAILNAAGTELRYDGSVTGMVPTLAHIHAAPAGMNGPVLFPLPLPAMGTVVTGEQAVTADDVAKLDAEGLYVNFHSAANPMGEVRGQLTKP
ncbi:MAG TPA: CHRD domain-containing protein [Polyangia bacterium]